jgi:3-dehydroquinate synthetase
LPKSEFLAGLAEVVKYAVIRDADFFAFLEEQADSILRLEAAPLKHAIRRSCALKAEVVGRDERERDVPDPGRDDSAGRPYQGRALLNYGHTFGHAFEQLLGYEGLTHGLAVALGMRCAARLAVRLGLLSEAEEARHNALLGRFGLPDRFPGNLDLEKAWEAMGRDKKASSGRRVFILPRRIGEAAPEINPPKEKVLEALRVVAGGAA